jgi:hypothetical protein
MKDILSPPTNDVDFLEGLVKGANIFFSYLANIQAKEKAVYETKRTLDSYIRKYRETAGNLFERLNTLLEHPEFSEYLSEAVYQEMFKTLDDSLNVLLHNLYSLKKSYESLGRLLEKKLLPREIDQLIHNVEIVIGESQWADKKQVEKARKEYQAGQVKIV